MMLARARWIVLPVALASAAACGSGAGATPEAAGAGSPSPSAEPSSGSGGVTPPAPPGSPPPTPPPPPSSGGTCTGKDALTGDQTFTVSSGGTDRTALVHLPPGYSPAKAMPVVLNFHGYLGDAAGEASVTGMTQKADAAGFIAVHPQGLDSSWNAGACCGNSASQQVDDVGFVSKLLDELEARLCVDTKRIFATGMSNGGFLSHRLACELSDRIAAVAPVAGVLGIPTCNPTRPMSVMHFHGTSDPLVPYDGNPAISYPSVPDTFAGWGQRSGCATTTTQTYSNGDVTCKSFDGCAAGAEVILCTVDGGGHQWPGGQSLPLLGKTTNDIKATDAMWDFFVKHPMP